MPGIWHLLPRRSFNLPAIFSRGKTSELAGESVVGGIAIATIQAFLYVELELAVHMWASVFDSAAQPKEMGRCEPLRKKRFSLTSEYPLQQERYEGNS